MIMSSHQSRNFRPVENPPAVHNDFLVDRGMTYQDTSPPSLPPQVRNPQPSYPPSLNAGSLDDHKQSYQRRTSNEAQLGSHETANPTARTSVSPRTSEQYRAYDRSQYASASQSPPVAEQYDSQTFQYRSSPGISTPQGHSPQPAIAQKRNVPQTRTPVSRKALPYPSPPVQEQQVQYPSPTARELGVQYSSPPFQRNVSPYSPPPADATLSSDRSTIGSPLPQMSPNSLQRELEKTKDYSENILTKLIETQSLLKERDAEIARLHDLLATQHQYGGGASNGWELDDLRRKLHEQGQALRAAQDDVTRAQSHAQHQRSQAEWYSQELFQLKESQSRIQQQPQVNPAQMEESRKVTDFYKQKADQLSRDNMSINQQNRKLTEDLAAAQRKVQEQRNLVDSMR